MSLALFFGRLMRVCGHSMEPTLRPGALVLVGGVAYKDWSPRHGDLVAARPSSLGGMTFVKRVVGLPGERVQVEEREWRLGDGEFFLLSDQAKSSVDSRVFGPVTREEMVGLVRPLGRRRT